MRRGSPTCPVLIVVDSVNLLVNSCDSERPELELIEFLNQLTGHSDADEHVSMAVSTNRDLMEAGSLSEAFYRESKHATGMFSLVLECSKNLAGHSRDVHGQLNVI